MGKRSFDYRLWTSKPLIIRALFPAFGETWRFATALPSNLFVDESRGKQSPDLRLFHDFVTNPDSDL
ncbi:MAG: hypothetical protein AAGA58_08035 [Verrucomicrobiota bacterium]